MLSEVTLAILQPLPSTGFSVVLAALLCRRTPLTAHSLGSFCRNRQKCVSAKAGSTKRTSTFLISVVCFHIIFVFQVPAVVILPAF